MKRFLFVFKQNTFLRYIVSFAVAFLIPMLIMGFVAYNNIIYMFEQEVMHNNITLLDKSKSATEYQFEQILYIPLLLQNDRLFTTNYPLDYYNYFVDATTRLSSMRGINGVVHDVLFYRAGNDYLISSIYGKTDLGIYASKICTYADWPAEDFLSTISHPGPNLWRGSEDALFNSVPAKVITYIYYNNIYRTAFIIQINSQRFDTFMKDNYQKDGGSTYILDGQGRLIYSTQDGPISLDRTVIQEIENNALDSAYLPGKGMNKNHLYYSNSSLTGFTYVREIPYNYSKEKVDILKNILLLTLILLLILSIIVVYFLARSNYKPIRQLGNLAKKIFSNPEVPGDDLGRAKYVIENLSQINTEIITSSQKPMKEYMLLKLLRGAYASIEEFNQEGSKTGLRLDADSYRVALLRIGENQVNPVNISSLVLSIEQMLDGGLQTYCIEGTDPSSIIVLFAYNQDVDFLDRLPSYIEKIRAFVVSYKCGVGNEIHEAWNMFDTYSKAKLALQQASMNDEENLATYDFMVDSEPIIVDYPKIELESLSNAIKEGNAAKLDFILADLNRWIKSSNRSFFLSLCTGFDIINTMLKAVKDSGLDSQQSLLPADVKFAMSEINSIDQIIGYIHTIGNKIMSQMQARGMQKNSSFSGKVKDYIIGRISHPDLSLQIIADAFGMSVSNLSHQFKNDSKENLSDLIARLRMQKAKEMLHRTNLSLNEISSSLGYSHVTSFVRKFKQEEGITPGEYRKRYSS